MGKVQTRRSVSLNRAVYDMVKEHCYPKDISISAFVERLVLKEIATPEQRANYEIIGDGQGVHWPDIAEDISAQGMLYGTPAPAPRSQ